MDVVGPAVSPSPMNPESKQNGGSSGGGGKTSPPISCDDPQQQQQHQQQQQQRPTRYITNSTHSGSINKISNRSNSSTCKNKSLVRSHAVSEETSPPPPDGVSASTVVSNNNKNGKLRQNSSQQSSSLESSLSLDNNIVCEKNGSEDNDLLDFIIETINKSAKDRSLIFRIESDLISFIKDTKRTSFSFPQMTSYQRMLVHRVSGYFHLDHNLDSASNCVVVTKNKNTRVPETRFREYVEDQQPGQESGKPVVLKRESAGVSKKGNEDQSQGMNKARGKSLEERAEDYNRARRRIFNSEQQSDSGVCCWSSSTESNTTNELHVKPGRHFNRKSAVPNSNTLLKVESFETATINRKNKPPVVNKSYSFGGYGATDGNNAVIGNSNNMSLNRFSKQDSSSSSSGLSPASSGYKSQSFQSSTENTMTTPNSSASPQNNLAPPENVATLNIEGLPPPNGAPQGNPPPPPHCVLTPVHPHNPLSQQQYIIYPASSSNLIPASGLMQGAPLQIQPHPGGAGAPLQQPQQNPSHAENVVLWAVTDLNHVPPGSILIDPNSGQALKNTDGTMYHYDPTNPPKQVIPQPQTPELVMYPSPQPQLQTQQQQQQMINTPGGDMEHVTQWFSQVGIQPPPHHHQQQHQQQQHQQQQHPSLPVNQPWGGEEYYVTSPHQPQPPPASGYIAAGGAPIIWDPSKIASGTIGLNQQYYPMPAPPQHPPPPPPAQQPHYVVAAPPPNATQQPSQPVVMQYSVPTSTSATAPYMYMLQPYNPIAAAVAAANYNSLVQYGQQPQQAPRQMHPANVHQTPQQPIKLSKEFCYVPTSTTPAPATSTACLYNPFYGNPAIAAAAAAAAAHVQNQPGGGHRFPGNPSVYPAPFIPRPSNSGYNNCRSNVKQPRKNRGRNFSSNNDRSVSQHHHQQQQPPPPPPSSQQQQQPTQPSPSAPPQQQQQQPQQQSTDKNS